MVKPDEGTNVKNIWQHLRYEAEMVREVEPILTVLMGHILDHKNYDEALASILAIKLADESQGLGYSVLFPLFCGIAAEHHDAAASKQDLLAVLIRDPAVTHARTPFLYFKGFHALQTHRFAHHLWNAGRKDLALALQSLSSERFQVDIHPSARIGRGVMIDHGTGVVIGETAVVEDDVSILHGATLGGTGKGGQDRHPKIRKGSLVGAHALILGNIEIGIGARVAAGSVVLKNVPPRTTVAGNPSRVVGTSGSSAPGKEMDQVSGVMAPEVPADSQYSSLSAKPRNP